MPLHRQHQRPLPATLTVLLMQLHSAQPKPSRYSCNPSTPELLQSRRSGCVQSMHNRAPSIVSDAMPQARALRAPPVTASPAAARGGAGL